MCVGFFHVSHIFANSCQNTFFLCTANLENNLFISTKEYHTIYQRFSSQLLAQIISSAAECDMAEYESPSVLREPVVMKWNIVRI